MFVFGKMRNLFVLGLIVLVILGFSEGRSPTRGAPKRTPFKSNKVRSFYFFFLTDFFLTIISDLFKKLFFIYHDPRTGPF